MLVCRRPIDQHRFPRCLRRCLFCGTDLPGSFGCSLHPVFSFTPQSFLWQSLVLTLGKGLLYLSDGNCNSLRPSTSLRSLSNMRVLDRYSIFWSARVLFSLEPMFYLDSRLITCNLSTGLMVGCDLIKLMWMIIKKPQQNKFGLMNLGRLFEL